MPISQFGPEQVAAILIEIKERGTTFKFDGNRAIVFDKSDKLPSTELKHCISLALTYHSVKHLPMLGV